MLGKMAAWECNGSSMELNEEKCYYIYVQNGRIKLSEAYEERLRQNIIGVFGPLTDNCSASCRFFVRALSPGQQPLYDVRGGSRQCSRAAEREAHFDINERFSFWKKDNHGEVLEMAVVDTFSRLYRKAL
jgi:hypothetical protein